MGTNNEGVLRIELQKPKNQNHENPSEKLEQLKAAAEEYATLINIKEDKLEYIASEKIERSFRIMNLTKRYKAFQSAKRLYKIAELIRKEREKNVK